MTILHILHISFSANSMAHRNPWPQPAPGRRQARPAQSTGNTAQTLKETGLGLASICFVR
jgi:hypothetical protein